MNKTDLSTFSNPDYDPGRSTVVRILWFYINLFVFRSGIFPMYGLKRFLLKLFGANIGKGVVIKPHVNIKFPWLLFVGNYSWIGENVWIDNLAQVTIGNNVCISQGAMLLTGNHNYKKSSFDLVTGEIKLEDGVWIGTKSIVCPGVCCYSHSILTVNSVATSNLKEYTIYQGNPAKEIRKRIIAN